MVPCVGGEISRDDLDQGRLAGPIVADQADDLAGCHGIVDLGERANGAELHADAAQLQKAHRTKLMSQRPVEQPHPVVLFLLPAGCADSVDIRCRFRCSVMLEFAI